ncbi:hypothetical protein CMUS01_14340 [Colletotrichum musicola]|uniref:Uncharacterized protein n=1 Tax=Colletotrichum musicola TaxID=2175873 RepID=A0A8H6J4S5_9PEZI|nr:hypothetical protein CMUS01_14340 [Colletotrichum musicola]
MLEKRRRVDKARTHVASTIFGIAKKAFYSGGCENAQAEYRDRMRDSGRDATSDLDCQGLDLNETRAFGSAIISFVLAAFSFPSRAIKLVKSWSDAAKGIAKDRCSNPTRSLIRKSMERERFFVGFLLIQIYLLAKIYADLLSSELSDVYWILISAIWGTNRLQQLRDPTTEQSTEMRPAAEHPCSPSIAPSEARGLLPEILRCQRAEFRLNLPALPTKPQKMSLKSQCLSTTALHQQPYPPARLQFPVIYSA